MTLPEDDDFVFELFVDWIYHGHYDLPLADTPGHDLFTYKRRVQLFILADKYDVPKLKSHVFSELFYNIKEGPYSPSNHTITYAYEHTFQNSVIRKLLADHIACEWSSDVFENPKNQGWLRAHPDISMDVIISLVRHRTDWQTFFSGEIP